jgi:hypothetical protein
LLRGANCSQQTVYAVDVRHCGNQSSAEGRRARLDRAHPGLSRAIGVFSATVLGITLLASTETALGLRFNRLLDGAAS